MPSLKHRVAQQRDLLIARAPGIRWYAGRVYTRLRHPAVLVPAFLAGMIVARVAPTMLRVLPEFTARLRHLTKELHKLDTFVKMTGALMPVIQRSFSVGINYARDAQTSPRQGSVEDQPPPT